MFWAISLYIPLFIYLKISPKMFLKIHEFLFQIAERVFSIITVGNVDILQTKFQKKLPKTFSRLRTKLQKNARIILEEIAKAFSDK